MQKKDKLLIFVIRHSLIWYNISDNYYQKEVLMKKKYILIFSILMVILLVGCSSEPAVEESSEEMDEMKVFSLDELTEYDGSDGNPAYVAVDGLVYDVSDVPAWTGGEHKGNMAGQDVTDAIKNQSPHGISKLKNLPVVGKLEE